MSGMRQLTAWALPSSTGASPTRVLCTYCVRFVGCLPRGLALMATRQGWSACSTRHASPSLALLSLHWREKERLANCTLFYLANFLRLSSQCCSSSSCFATTVAMCTPQQRGLRRQPPQRYSSAAATAPAAPMRLLSWPDEDVRPAVTLSAPPPRPLLPLLSSWDAVDAAASANAAAAECL